MNERLASTFTGRSLPRARFAGRFDEPPRVARASATVAAPATSPPAAAIAAVRASPFQAESSARRSIVAGSGRAVGSSGCLVVERRHLDRLGLQQLLAHPLLTLRPCQAAASESRCS